MSRKLSLLIFAIVTILSAGASRLEKQGTATRLIVDDKPFVIIGGELGNSAATCTGDIARNFKKLHDMGLNTVLVPAYWDLIEPEKGKFDFSLIDTVISDARSNDLKVVFLWFGAWKNSMSCYVPLWFKQDYKTYPRARTRSGKPLEIASAFSSAVFQADAEAFTALLGHIKAVDNDETVIMIQIENEIGMLEDARDYSEAATAEYDKGVPAALMKHLDKNKKSLHPSLLDKWQRAGMKKSGSWSSVFGDDIYTDELFMAYNYGRYVEGLAQIARRIDPAMPLYVNAAMNSRGRRPGEYPSAGPLAHLKDIWHAAAPSVDILAPDLYDSGFTDWVRSYALPDNPLFIPEIRRRDGNAVQTLYVLGEHDAIGLSPFAIEGGSDNPADRDNRGRAMIKELLPVITANLGRGTMNGLYFDADSITRTINRDGMTLKASHFFTLPWDPRATDGSEWPVAGGIIIPTGEGEYIIAGSGIVVEFDKPGNTPADTRNLGEDGFLNSGADRKAGQAWSGRSRIGLGPVSEVRVNPDGSLTPVRHFNGDETHQGRHVRIGVDDYKILRVKLYEYK